MAELLIVTKTDIGITEDSDLVYKLYAKKNGSCFVNKVTGFQMDDMHSDLIERVRSMTSIRSINHLWKQMSDEDLLRSAGLIKSMREDSRL